MILLIISKKLLLKRTERGGGEKKRGEEEAEGENIKSRGWDGYGEKKQGPHSYGCGNMDSVLLSCFSHVRLCETIPVQRLGHYYITWHFIYDGLQNNFLVGICTSWLIFLLRTLACFLLWTLWILCLIMFHSLLCLPGTL